MLEIFEARFAQILAENGWGGPDKFSWSLNYCQGDGVAFFGTVDDPASLVERLAPASRMNAFLLPFVPGAYGSIKIGMSHRGPGPAHMSLEVEPSDALDEDDDDSAHRSLLKRTANQHWFELEKLLAEDLRRVAELLQRAGYAINEAVDPNWWSGFNPEWDKPITCRRIERASIAIEWQISALDCHWDRCDGADDIARALSEDHVGCELRCIAYGLDPQDESEGEERDEDECDEDKDWQEIASSPTYVILMPRAGWNISKEFRSALSESFLEIRDEVRDAMPPRHSAGLAPAPLTPACEDAA